MQAPDTKAATPSGADTRCGPYYVSVIRPEKPEDPRLLSGPYAKHESALAAVAEATRLATDLDPRAAFYAFGTVRMRADFDKPGILNERGLMSIASDA